MKQLTLFNSGSKVNMKSNEQLIKDQQFAMLLQEQENEANEKSEASALDMENNEEEAQKKKYQKQV